MRWWNELVGAVGEVVPLSAVVLILVALASIVAALWYYFPAWVPRRWPRLRRPRWRLRRPRWRWPRWRWPRWLWRWPLWSRRRKADREEPAPGLEPTSGDEVPDLPATTFVDLADRLAAEGRYAEAIRERLRGMVRELIEAGVLEHRPGWTVTELAAAAASRRPAVAGPLTAAGALFSDIWYRRTTRVRRARRPHARIGPRDERRAGRRPTGRGDVVTGVAVATVYRSHGVDLLSADTCGRRSTHRCPLKNPGTRRGANP
jgi:hypothetical protein